VILVGDALQVLRTRPAGEARCCVTSPPYWALRDYGVEGQLGLEATPEEYVAKLVEVFREVRRVLAANGTLWLNLGDVYAASGRNSTEGFNARWHGKHFSSNKQADVDRKRPRRPRSSGGLKPKDLVGIPWMVAFALRADGWYLRQDIIWHKPNPMPESVQDRCTRAHEYLFLLSKSPRYYFDADAIKTPVKPKTLTVRTTPTNGNGTGSTGEKWNKWVAENGGGRRHYPTANKRDVWTISSRPFHGAHFAVFPQGLVEPCVLAGSAPGDLVLDPFAGAGTTGLVAERLGRRFLGIELNPEYAEMAERRLKEDKSA
jgi:DNA modification methylase